MNTTTQPNTTNMATTRTINNPYAKNSTNAVQNGGEMGRQSQQRNSQQKRAFALASNTSRKKKKGDQTTLLGGKAFVAEEDCEVCKAKAAQRFRPQTRIPKRAHHVLCLKNTKTKGKGELTQHEITCLQEEKRLDKLYNTPLQEQEKASWRHSDRAAGEKFFAPQKKNSIIVQKTNMAERKISNNTLSAAELCKGVTTLVSDLSFCEQHKDKIAPLAMLALAEIVASKTLKKEKDEMFHDNFDGLTMTVPLCTTQFNPHYHSIVGSKLMVVDWKRSFGLEIACPDSSCPGMLKNDRTNFSKNKTLFPILFNLDGAPTWCMVMSMVCPCCKRRFDSNQSEFIRDGHLSVGDKFCWHD
jgi:hypothetical protein